MLLLSSMLSAFQPLVTRPPAVSMLRITEAANGTARVLPRTYALGRA